MGMEYFDEHDVWYRNAMRDAVVLTIEEEAKFGRAILDGRAEDAAPEMVESGKMAQEELVKNNLPLVYSIASEHKYKVVEKSDLVQEGNIGLIKAAEKFDVEKGVKFSTYATYWIRKYIRKAVSDAYNYNNVVERFVENEDDDEDAYYNMFGADEHDYYADALDALTKDYVNEKLHEGLDSLGGMYRDIIGERYGLDGSDAKTVDEIAREHGISRVGVRTIEGCALKKLKKDVCELESCVPE